MKGADRTMNWMSHGSLPTEKPTSRPNVEHGGSSIFSFRTSHVILNAWEMDVDDEDSNSNEMIAADPNNEM
jgi:hypothetical protein